MAEPGGFMSFAGALVDPLVAFGDPSQRVFWPFLLASAALALLVRHRVSVPPRARPRLREIWLHPSALLDYRLLFVKAVLRATLLVPWMVSTIAVAAATLGGLRGSFGSLPDLAVSPWLVGVLFTVATFLMDDFTRYFVHRLMHRIPALWELHKVHHSATVLTPFSLYRTHPIESFINGARGALAIGATTGVFVWMFGGKVHGWQLLGVDAIGFVWTLCGANLRHSHVWLSYGPKLERLLISPAQHQVHHSDATRHHGRNFGEILSLWDWLGGSLYVTRKQPEPIAFGLSPHEPAAHTLAGAIVTPILGAIAALARDVRRLAQSPARVLLVAALGLGGASCGSKQKLDRAALLRSCGGCALASYQAFALEAVALTGATAAAVTGQGSKTAAQEAWIRAMDVWQQVELMQLGPAALPPSPGGQNLREGIYAWPDVSRCLIEQQLVARTYEDASALAIAPASTRGMAAIEYLLFGEAADNACPAAAALNASGAWAALSSDELAARKAGYAHAAAADVAVRAEALAAAWRPEGGNFLGELAAAGAGSTVYPTQSAALDAIAGALFHLDVVTKDRKLAQPLGLKDCATTTCPDAVESTWAGRSKQAIANNLRGFRRLAFGCEPDGSGLAVDDLLVSVGAGDVAADLLAKLAAADAAIEQIAEPDLATSLAMDREAVLRVHDAVKGVTFILKDELVLVLSITVPGRVSGDHD